MCCVEVESFLPMWSLEFMFLDSLEVSSLFSCILIRFILVWLTHILQSRTLAIPSTILSLPGGNCGYKL